MSVFRIYVEKKPEFAVEAKNLFSDIRTALRLESLRNIRILNRYDSEGLTEEDFWMTDFSRLRLMPKQLRPPPEYQPSEAEQEKIKNDLIFKSGG